MGLIDAFPKNVNLDNKKFDDIVNEARTLLARYGKEWTDYNFSDPGITFIELFAWLAEMQIYQLNRVTDANYRKFLKLVGMTPAFAQPARVDITFEDGDNNLEQINTGSQVITEIGAEKIKFETEEPLTIIAGKIKSILTTFDYQTIDNTISNEKGDVYFAAFGERAPVGAALQLGFDNSFPGKEIRISFVLYVEDLKSEGKHDFEPSALFPSVTLIWEYKTKGKMKTLSVKKDTTHALTRSGRVVFVWPSDIDKDEDKGVYWIQCRILRGSYEIAPLVSRVLLNTISAVQIERIREDLGKGQGVPDQVVKLKNSPYINRIDFIGEDILDWLGFLNQLKEKENSYVFSWDEIPGKDNGKLIDFLKQSYHLDWLKTAKIQKTDENKIIKVFFENNYLSLSLNDEKTRVILTINDCRTTEFIVNVEKGKLNIYKKSNSVDTSPEKKILRLFEQQTQDCINGWNGDKEPDDVLKYAVIESLNKILNIRELYDFNSFKYVDLSQLPKKFLKILFNWEEIQDNKVLIEKLILNFNVDWIRTANIDKDIPNTIKIFNENNCLSIALNNQRTRLNLRISDGRIYVFPVLSDNCKINIHYLTKKIEVYSDLEAKKLNRFLIEAVFPNNIEKNRLIIQIGKIDGESEYWNEMEDFELSGPEDTHYIFNKEKNEIIFGNGLNGRIPVDSQNILASYKTTLGPGGNIPGGQNFLINESGIRGIKGKNMKAATLGKAAESMDDAKNRAKKECREIYRAITSEDYEYLAINTPGLRVARAKAIPNYNHDIPLIKIPDAVTVVAVPYTRERKNISDLREENNNPIAGEGFLQTILRHLDQHRLITTDILVIGPKYEKITISCNIHIKKGKSSKKIEELTKKKIDRFLSPIKGGPDGTGWPFGRAVYPSEIFRIIDEVEGVDYATNLSFIDEKKRHYKGIIKISPVSLTYPGDHEFRIIEAKV